MIQKLRDNFFTLREGDLKKILKKKKKEIKIKLMVKYFFNLFILRITHNGEKYS